MMKKYLAALTALILCFALSVPASAAAPRLTDHADLLTSVEEEVLLSRLDSASEQYQVELIVVTVEGLEGLTPEAYANRFYDDHLYGLGDGRDGVLFLVSMEERDWYILTNGFGHTAITDDEVMTIGEYVAGYLGDGDYATAFDAFIEECVYEIDGEINGFPFAWGTNLLIAAVVGLVAALIVTGIWRGQLKSVKRRPAATEYTKSGSLKVTHSTDLFLYRTVNRIKKPTNNSSGGGGGGSRGGGGGKF